MNKSLRALLPAVLLALATLPQAEASIISASSTSPDVDTSNCNSTRCDIVKNFQTTDPLPVSITVDSSGGTVFETIKNNTGIPWTDFHWLLGADFPPSAITISAFNPPFSHSTSSGFPFTVYDGSVLAGNSFSVEISIGATSGGTFMLAQMPSTALPEPATLALLGLGLVGIAATSRRRPAAA